MNLQSTINFLHFVAHELRRLADGPYVAALRADVVRNYHLYTIAAKLDAEARDLEDVEEKYAQGR